MKYDEQLNRIYDLKERLPGDKLTQFVLNGEGNISDIQDKYLQELFSLAQKYGLTYIYIGKGELCGCEDKRQPGGTWPAIWAISGKLFTRGSCGNSDQHQNDDYKGRYFPEDAYGGWNLKTKKKLSKTESLKLNFKRVITDPRWNGKDPDSDK